MVIHISKESVLIGIIITLVASLIAVGIFYGYTNYANLSDGSSEINTEAAYEYDPENSSFNTVGQIAEEYFGKECGQLTNDWAISMMGYSPAGVHVMAPKSEGESLSLSVEVVYPKEGVSYISADISPRGDDGKGCALVYDRTTHWGGECDLVVKYGFVGYLEQRTLRERIAYLIKESNHLFLIPLQGGCLTIEKTAIYEGSQSVDGSSLLR